MAEERQRCPLCDDAMSTSGGAYVRHSHIGLVGRCPRCGGNLVIDDESQVKCLMCGDPLRPMPE